MNLLNRLTIKSLKLNKKRTVVTIVGIILSIMLITAVSSIFSSLISSATNYERQYKGNYHAAFSNIPASELETIYNNRKIKTVNVVENIGFAAIDSKNAEKPYALVKAFSDNALNNLAVNLIEGRLPENENEILIPKNLSTNGGSSLKTGDEITLNIGQRIDASSNVLPTDSDYMPDEKLEDTTGHTYKIVGLCESLPSNIEPYSSPGFTFITHLDDKAVSSAENLTLYLEYTKDGLRNADKLTSDISGLSSSYKLISVNSYLIQLETNPFSIPLIETLSVAVFVVLLIIVFTSVFCIKNSFDISITEKTRQYGMLRSVGATRKQIQKNVFYEGSILGLIGIPAGIATGFLASFILVNVSDMFLKDIFNASFQLEFSFSLFSVIIAVVLGIITIYFSSLESARKAAAVSPIVSIKNSAGIKISQKQLKAPKLIRRIFGIGGEISYKNLKRSKKKYRTTTISITVSVFVFIALYSFMNLLSGTINDAYAVPEYNIMFTIYSDTEPDLVKRLTSLDNIDDYTILRTSPIAETSADENDEALYDETYGPTIYMAAIGNEQYDKYISSIGLNLETVKNKGILYKSGKAENVSSSGYSAAKNYDVSDIIKGYFENDPDIVFPGIEVGAVTDKKPFGLGDMEDFIVVSDEFYDSANTSNYISIIYRTDDADALQDDIENIISESLLAGREYHINNIDENVRMLNNFRTLVAIFLYGFIIVIALIGVTNIFNTITTSMELRRPEFAMLRSIGMTKKEFNRMIRLESIFLGLRSLIYGIVIGLVLSVIIYKAAGLIGSYRPPVIAIVISSLVVFALISLIMRYSINRINKQNIIETIRNENI
ncbi:MAG: FtsX-like permease family protein [Candidatus Alectryocaccobium sp.]|nr:FtsX-like permease family protein [Candidatus Alectryocaccobium sp.]